MTFSSVFISMIGAFLTSAALCPVMIPILRTLNINQYVRCEGPKSHLKKAGTPTMGGIVILICSTGVNLLGINGSREECLLIFTFLGFGAIGFLDDYIKVCLKRSLGLSVLQKIILQSIVTLWFCYYYIFKLQEKCEMLIPFTGGIKNGIYLSVSPILFVFIVYIIMMGTVNGANFTDGLDCLAASVTLLIVVFFSTVAIKLNRDMALSGACVAGALIGFLIFNVHPAAVFMGDTGSLALGGFVAAIATMLKMPLYIAIVGVVYLAEVLSVIIQVSYFKISGGKRLLKMAPLHHHFEQCGWRETTVVAVYSVITTVMCIAVILEKT